MREAANDRGVRAELLYREVNERIREAGAGLFEIEGAEALSVVCECVRLSCTERVALPADAYSSVRDRPARFLVLPGHEAPHVERVVETYASYLVVEKDADVVRTLQPGSGARV